MAPIIAGLVKVSQQMHQARPCMSLVEAETYFRPKRLAKYPPVNMPKVLDISAKPCQYETTVALIAGLPLIVVSAIWLMKACMGITLPGICCWNCRTGQLWYLPRRNVLTPSLRAAQLRIMQKSIAFQKVLHTVHRPRADSLVHEQFEVSV
jgi:hypothetical protein